MQALLAVIVAWISINIGLPETRELPSVEFATTTEMAGVRHARLAAVGGVQPAEGIGEDVYAIYDDASRTIFLYPDWTGNSPADISVLVHEMVHHLQNVAGMTFACAGEREKDAYRAQRAWLELFDRTLEQEFELDAMTVMLRSTCGY